MMMEVTDLTRSLSAGFESIIGDIVSQNLAVALFALIMYDYVITFDDEVKHYWGTSFTISQALFFFNRYFPILSNLFILVCQMLENPTDEFCEHGVPATFILTFFGIIIIQAILITRIWFLFPTNQIIQFSLIFSFLLSVSISAYFLDISIYQLRFIPLAHTQKVFGKQVFGCRAVRPPGFWRFYLPSLALHTGMYVLTVYQAKAGPHCERIMGMRKKLLTDGGIFYFIVLCSVSLTSIGSFLMNLPQINVPAIFSPIVLTTNSIATSRIMFSLRSIVARDEDSLEWVVTTDGPAAPLPESPSPGMSIFKCKTKKWHQRTTYVWSTETIPAPRLTVNLGPDLMILSKDMGMDEVVPSKQSLKSDVDRYYSGDGQRSGTGTRKHQYGSLYDEEKGLDDAYKQAMRTGEVFF